MIRNYLKIRCGFRCWPIAVLILTMMIASGASGQNLTVGDDSGADHIAFTFAPYMFSADRGESKYRAHVSSRPDTGQQYGYMEYTLPQNTPKPGKCTVAQFYEIIRDNESYLGTLLITTHGDPDKLSIEPYENTPAGLIARDARYQQYLDGTTGIPGLPAFTEAQIYKSTNADAPYAIGIRAAFVTTYGRLTQGLVYVAACHGESMTGDFVAGNARVSVGNSDSPTPSTQKTRVTTFFERMDGVHGQLNRPVAKAMAGLSLAHSGETNTTLAPSVLVVYAPCPIMTGSKVYYLLDTRCEVGIPPDIVGYGCTIENETWLDGYFLEGTCTAPPPPGSFAFGLRLKWDDTYSDQNVARLDGNTNPPGINARGPAHDDHLSSFDCPPTRVNRHNQDGYRPPHGDPRGTLWHELYPNYCQMWELTSWIDGGNNKLSFCDFVDFTHTETGVVSWEHVIGVTTTIVVTDGRDTHYMEFMGENPDVEPIFEPISTLWYEKWPGYSRQYYFEDWVDDGDGYLSPSDNILLLSLSPPDEGALLEYQIVEVATDLTTTPIMVVTIEKTHDTYQGQHEFVDVTMEHHPYEMGGFDFLIAYDASALALQTAVPGPAFYDTAPDGCGWEYFTYRYGPFGNCGDACPSGMARVFGLAETNNGPNHPSCFLPDSLPATLFSLDFLVSNDRTLECMYVPVRFFWTDCGDNTISSVDGGTLYVSDHVYEFEGTDITDSTYGFPTYFGVQPFCLNPDPDKPTAIQLVNFWNGGVDIICADSIDDRGDINLNGVVNEVADAVLFSNYFVHGISVFNVNVDGQIAASDVNADGITLSVADLVYLIRIIVGDALPYPKLSPVIAEADLVSGVLSVNADMGAAYVVVENSVTPLLLAESMEMKYQYDEVSNLTHILVYSMEEGRRFAGDFLGGIDGNVITLEMATYEGAPVTTKLVPEEFALYPCYPNPFNPITTISFALAAPVNYELVIYNSLGQTVETFSDRSGPGLERIDWNASGFASGVYFYRLTAGDFTDTKKMVLLK